MAERSIPLASVDTILKQAGAERVGEDAKHALREFLEKQAGAVTRRAAQFASHAGRKTIRAEDIKLVEAAEHSLK